MSNENEPETDSPSELEFVNAEFVGVSVRGFTDEEWEKYRNFQSLQPGDKVAKPK